VWLYIARMKIRLACVLLFATGCAIGGDEPDGIRESALSENCSFIPGCHELLEASDGPFAASVMTYTHDGETRRRLAVTYHERAGSQFLLCSRFPNQPALTLVFVVGEGTAATSINQAMRVDCPSSWGDNVGQPNTASFSVVEDTQPALWDSVFPPALDGERWFALQLAATNAHGAWDSKYGTNYRLVLAPR
jgi:hypothetical protein